MADCFEADFDFALIAFELLCPLIETESLEVGVEEEEDLSEKPVIDGQVKRYAYSCNTSRIDLFTCGELDMVQSTIFGYKSINCLQTAVSTLPGGASFREVIKVASAFSTKDISLRRCLGNGQGQSCSSSTYFTMTSLNLFRMEATANLFTMPMLCSGEADLLVVFC